MDDIYYELVELNRLIMTLGRIGFWISVWLFLNLLLQWWIYMGKKHYPWKVKKNEI